MIKKLYITVFLMMPLVLISNMFGMEKNEQTFPVEKLPTDMLMEVMLQAAQGNTLLEALQNVWNLALTSKTLQSVWRDTTFQKKLFEKLYNKFLVKIAERLKQLSDHLSKTPASEISAQVVRVQRLSVVRDFLNGLAVLALFLPNVSDIPASIESNLSILYPGQLLQNPDVLNGALISLIDTDKWYLFRYLIERKRVNINVNGQHISPILFYAIQLNDLELIEYLVEQGADLNIKNLGGNKPSDHAKMLGYNAISEYLKLKESKKRKKVEKETQESKKRRKL